MVGAIANPNSNLSRSIYRYDASHPSTSSYSEGAQTSSKRHNVAFSASPDLRESSVDRSALLIHVISAKLESSELEDLASRVEKHAARRVGMQRLELTADPDHADVIVTAIRTRPRLERHISWKAAKTKCIVTPDWLRDSIDTGTIQPCGKYAALGDTFDETERPCLNVESKPVTSHHVQSPVPLGQEDGHVRDTDIASLNYLSPFSCQRSSPLTCPNQTLIEELDIIRRARLYEGEERSMLSYSRAIASIKAYPHCFRDQTPPDDIAKLPYLGPKLTSMVKEFAETGKISEAQNILSSTRFQILSTFNTIHGIGPQTARHLYSLGLQTIEDLDKYYEVIPGITYEGTSGKELGVEKSIQISLALRHDLNKKIPRQEAEEINQAILLELELIEAGCKCMIVGGYRRGKQEGNDVDIVVSHTNWEHGARKIRGLCKRLVQRLHERGLVKYVLNMSGYRPHNIFRTHHWDSLEKALTVFVLPGGPARKRMYRRVDLIFAAPDIFWTAVVGWTGSTMFERDLRLWAKREKGLKFDSSGITRLHDSKLFLPKTEREVFDLLGLAYVHPHLRNADV